MKPPFYSIATIHEKNRDGTFQKSYVVTTPTQESETFPTLEAAREFVRIDQIPTPKPTIERIKAKPTPVQREKIMEAKRIAREAYEAEQLERFERSEELKRIQSRQFWEKIQLSALIIAIAIVIVHVFLS